jgi:hypothetical protein
LDFANNIYQIEEIDRLVHKDIFYSWAMYLGKQKRSTVLFKRKIKLLRRRYIKQAWQRHFLPAPQAIFHELIWRGEKVTDLNRDKIFAE